MKDPDIAPMNRADMADEIMLLRAQVKVLQNSLSLQEQGQDDYELARLRESHHNLVGQLIQSYEDQDHHTVQIDALSKLLELRNEEILFLKQELAWRRAVAVTSNRLDSNLSG